MYTRQQASLLKQSFWTAFGKYMAPVPSADGEKINWINYKTGVKHIHFRMDADHKSASIAIAFTNPEIETRQAHYRTLLTLKKMLEKHLGENWTWNPMLMDEHDKTYAATGTVLDGVNVFAEESWPAIITFLKPRIIALDVFWWTAKELFV